MHSYNNKLGGEIRFKLVRLACVLIQILRIPFLPSRSCGSRSETQLQEGKKVKCIIGPFKGYCWSNVLCSMVLLVQCAMLDGISGLMCHTRWYCWSNVLCSMLLLVQCAMLDGIAGSMCYARWYCWSNVPCSMVLLVQCAMLDGIAGPMCHA